MKNKLPLIIIAVVVAIILVIVLCCVLLINNDDKGSNNGETPEKQSNQELQISLAKEIDEENNKVIIKVNAKSGNNDKIKEIVLPDGSKITSEVATYTVQENGTYEFKTISESGKEATEKIEITEIEEISSTNPYIPKGFTEVEGTVDEGFVIEDSYGNQYVWVPVETGKTIRKTEKDKNYKEDSSASDFVNSVSKYYGFYIARYEASKYENDEDIAVASVEGKNPWTNITYVDAANYAKQSAKIFNYEDCETAILNSYAWDTVLNWIDTEYKNYSSSTNYGNYSQTIYPTGNTETDKVKNIFDLAGNVREWTTEIFDEENSSKNATKSSKDKEVVFQRVIRGGAANLDKTPISHINYDENLSDNYWGFRTVLYK